jgi:hypothetical protein
MSTMEQREDIVRQDGLLVGIAGLSLICGMHFSPYFDPAFVMVKFFGPAFFVGSPLILFYFTSLLISASALIIAGIPAAIFERVTGRTRSDAYSLGIWLAGCLLLALPALIGAGGVR